MTDQFDHRITVGSRWMRRHASRKVPFTVLAVTLRTDYIEPFWDVWIERDSGTRCHESAVYISTSCDLLEGSSHDR